MNVTRIIGVIILILGAILTLVIENDGVDFISGLCIGAGFGLLLSRKVSRNSK